MSIQDVVGQPLGRRALLKAGMGAAAVGTLAACAGANTSGGGGADNSAQLLSTQFTPVEEKQRFEAILNKYVTDPKTGFNSMVIGDFTTQFKTQVAAKKLQFQAAGALHGDFAGLTDQMENIDELASIGTEAGVSDGLMKLGKMGGQNLKYIPWMQASYVVAVNKKALQWLPVGADVNSLTYDQFLAWAKAAKAGAGKPVFGFPAGPKGLYHRFFQGYLLPSFTGAQVTKFMSQDAIAGWNWMKEFWSVCNPASTNFDYMQEPLARGEVLVGWDHVARLVGAPKDNPSDWIMVPSPIGPKGLGYMLIVAGLAIPKGGDKAKATKIIKALLEPETQIEVLRQNAFFPVAKADLPADLPEPIKLEAQAVAKQAANQKAIPALPPVGLGAKDGEMSQQFKDCFREICLQNGDPAQVVQTYGAKIQALLDATQAPCWDPDPAGSGTCKVG